MPNATFLKTYIALSISNGIIYEHIMGAGGLHQDFLEIDFLVVSDRGE